jgi:hypothetical protein
MGNVKRVVVCSIAVVLCASIVFVCLLAYRAATISLEAEKTFHAYDLVIHVLARYLRANSGRWPKSWEDLAATVQSEAPAVFNWPADIREIQRRVRIDFELTTARVASMDEDHFTAVEQMGPNYGRDKGRINWFIGVARETSGQIRVPETPKPAEDGTRTP